MDDIFDRARKASVELLALSAGKRDSFLRKLSERLVARMDEILSANASDLLKMDKSNPLYDRLLLDEKRVCAIASDMAHVAELSDPLSRQLESRVLPNGLELRKVPVPFGLIGVIYEARPNVTFDVFSLCFKSGNACLLKGGKDADFSNRAGVRIIRETLAEEGLNPNSVNLLPAGHEAAAALLNAVGKVDLVIPRGGRRLIDFVRDNAKVPYIETGAGVVHAYFDESADLEKGRRIVNNAKTRRVGVCNALDCLIINEKRLGDLPALCEPLAASNVEIYADDAAFEALDGKYAAPLYHSTEESFGTEFLSYRMAVKTVPDICAAINHISRFGSGHSECIVTESQESAALFERDVDASCVYVNAPTSFTDGAQFGMGAEIGISTQKLGARGPMALNELTTYKWLVRGNGQTRG